jgi:hypothetical protein
LEGGRKISQCYACSSLAISLVLIVLEQQEGQGIELQQVSMGKSEFLHMTKPRAQPAKKTYTLKNKRKQGRP